VRSTPGWNLTFGQPLTITYAYRASVPSGADLPGGAVGFVPFNDEEIAATEQALHMWADVANITFVRVNDSGSNYSNNATILFYGYTSGAAEAAAFAYTPPGSTGSGSLIRLRPTSKSARGS
jgi:serralysin